MEPCPIVQYVAVFAFCIGIVIYLIVNFTIKRHVSTEYLKIKNQTLSGRWSEDFPELIPSSALTKIGVLLKWLSLLSHILIVLGVCYMGFLNHAETICVSTSFFVEW